MADPLLLLVLFSTILLILWRPGDLSEAWWVCGGALTLLATHRLLPAEAGKAIAKGGDVYLFLTGMMLLSELAREHGIFDWFASHAVSSAHGSRARLFGLIYAAGVLITAFMSNDATATVMTPAVLAAAKESGAGENDEPLPYLFACAMVANAASFLLPISNPANLVVFPGKALPSLARWIVTFGLPSIAAIAVTYLVLRLWFRNSLVSELKIAQNPKQLSPGGRVVMWGIAGMSAVLLTSSALKMNLGAPACIAALLLAIVVSAKTQTTTSGFLRSFEKPFGRINWSMLLLVAGLFCLVAAADRAGLNAWATAQIAAAQHWPILRGVFAYGLGLGILNNIVNNLPLGLIAGAAVQHAGVHGALTNAVLLGVDLGPNLSVTGSLATILWLIRLREGSVKVSSWHFLRIGVVAMPLALAAALGVVLLTGS